MEHTEQQGGMEMVAAVKGGGGEMGGRGGDSGDSSSSDDAVLVLSYQGDMVVMPRDGGEGSGAGNNTQHPSYFNTVIKTEPGTSEDAGFTSSQPPSETNNYHPLVPEAPIPGDLIKHEVKEEVAEEGGEEEDSLVDAGGLGRTARGLSISEQDLPSDIFDYRAGNLYRCKFCGHKFPDRQQLLQHIVRHIQKASLQKCRHCDFITTSTRKLKEHEWRHTNTKPYRCSQCPYKSGVYADFKVHLETHNEGKPFKCSVCDFRTKYRKGLKRHMDIHKEVRVKKHACPHCNLAFRMPSGLRNHLFRRHTDIKPIQCDECSYRCKTNYELRNHKMTHSNARPYSCPHPGCGQTFKTKSDCTKHTWKHKNVTRYTCQLCGKGFKLKMELNKHAIAHSQERDYECHHCMKKFKTLPSLQKHMLTHLEVKPFRCDVCFKTFSARGNLLTHRQVHEGDRPFKCPVCVYGGQKLEHLLVHIGGEHLNDFTYVCSVCRKPFFRSMHLHNHLRACHKDQMEGDKEEMVYDPQYLDLNFQPEDHDSALQQLAEAGIDPDTLLAGDASADKPKRGKKGMEKDSSTDENTLGADSGLDLSAISASLLAPPPVIQICRMGGLKYCLARRGSGFQFNHQKTGKKPKTWFMTPEFMSSESVERHKAYLISKGQKLTGVWSGEPKRRKYNGSGRQKASPGVVQDTEETEAGNVKPQTGPGRQKACGKRGRPRKKARKYVESDSDSEDEVTDVLSYTAASRRVKVERAAAAAAATAVTAVLDREREDETDNTGTQCDVVSSSRSKLELASAEETQAAAFLPNAATCNSTADVQPSCSAFAGHGKRATGPQRGRKNKLKSTDHRVVKGKLLNKKRLKSGLVSASHRIVKKRRMLKQPRQAKTEAEHQKETSSDVIVGKGTDQSVAASDHLTVDTPADVDTKSPLALWIDDMMRETSLPCAGSQCSALSKPCSCVLDGSNTLEREKCLHVSVVDICVDSHSRDLLQSRAVCVRPPETVLSNQKRSYTRKKTREKCKNPTGVKVSPMKKNSKDFRRLFSSAKVLSQTLAQSRAQEQGVGALLLVAASRGGSVTSSPVKTKPVSKTSTPSPGKRKRTVQRTVECQENVGSVVEDSGLLNDLTSPPQEPSNEGDAGQSPASPSLLDSSRKEEELEELDTVLLLPLPESPVAETDPANHCEEEESCLTQSVEPQKEDSIQQPTECRVERSSEMGHTSFSYKLPSVKARKPETGSPSPPVPFQTRTDDRGDACNKSNIPFAGSQLIDADLENTAASDSDTQSVDAYSTSSFMRRKSDRPHKIRPPITHPHSQIVLEKLKQVKDGESSGKKIPRVSRFLPQFKTPTKLLSTETHLGNRSPSVRELTDPLPCPSLSSACHDDEMSDDCDAAALGVLFGNSGRWQSDNVHAETCLDQFRLRSTQKSSLSPFGDQAGTVSAAKPSTQCDTHSSESTANRTTSSVKSANAENRTSFFFQYRHRRGLFTHVSSTKYSTECYSDHSRSHTNRVTGVGEANTLNRTKISSSVQHKQSHGSPTLVKRFDTQQDCTLSDFVNDGVEGTDTVKQKVKTGPVHSQNDSASTVMVLPETPDKRKEHTVSDKQGSTCSTTDSHASDKAIRSVTREKGQVESGGSTRKDSNGQDSARVNEMVKTGSKEQTESRSASGKDCATSDRNSSNDTHKAADNTGLQTQIEHALSSKSSSVRSSVHHAISKPHSPLSRRKASAETADKLHNKNKTVSGFRKNRPHESCIADMYTDNSKARPDSKGELALADHAKPMPCYEKRIKQLDSPKSSAFHKTKARSVARKADKAKSIPSGDRNRVLHGSKGSSHTTMSEKRSKTGGKMKVQHGSLLDSDKSISQLKVDSPSSSVHSTEKTTDTAEKAQDQIESVAESDKHRTEDVSEASAGLSTYTQEKQICAITNSGVSDSENDLFTPGIPSQMTKQSQAKPVPKSGKSSTLCSADTSSATASDEPSKQCSSHSPNIHHQREKKDEAETDSNSATLSMQHGLDKTVTCTDSSVSSTNSTKLQQHHTEPEPVSSKHNSSATLAHKKVSKVNVPPKRTNCVNSVASSRKSSGETVVSHSCTPKSTIRKENVVKKQGHAVTAREGSIVSCAVDKSTDQADSSVSLMLDKTEESPKDTHPMLERVLEESLALSSHMDVLHSKPAVSVKEQVADSENCKLKAKSSSLPKSNGSKVKSVASEHSESTSECTSETLPVKEQVKNNTLSVPGTFSQNADGPDVNDVCRPLNIMVSPLDLPEDSVTVPMLDSSHSSPPSGLTQPVPAAAAIVEESVQKNSDLDNRAVDLSTPKKSSATNTRSPGQKIDKVIRKLSPPIESPSSKDASQHSGSDSVTSSTPKISRKRKTGPKKRASLCVAESQVPAVEAKSTQHLGGELPQATNHETPVKTCSIATFQPSTGLSEAEPAGVNFGFPSPPQLSVSKKKRGRPKKHQTKELPAASSAGKLDTVCSELPPAEAVSGNLEKQKETPLKKQSDEIGVSSCEDLCGEPKKRGRGRPRKRGRPQKQPMSEPSAVHPAVTPRKRGRPRKRPLSEPSAVHPGCTAEGSESGSGSGTMAAEQSHSAQKSTIDVDDVATTAQQAKSVTGGKERKASQDQRKQNSAFKIVKPSMKKAKLKDGKGEGEAKKRKRKYMYVELDLGLSPDHTPKKKRPGRPPGPKIIIDRSQENLCFSPFTSPTLHQDSCESGQNVDDRDPSPPVLEPELDEEIPQIDKLGSLGKVACKRGRKRSRNTKNDQQLLPPVLQPELNMEQTGTCVTERSVGDSDVEFVHADYSGVDLSEQRLPLMITPGEAEEQVSGLTRTDEVTGNDLINSGEASGMMKPLTEEVLATNTSVSSVENTQTACSISHHPAGDGVVGELAGTLKISYQEAGEVSMDTVMERNVDVVGGTPVAAETDQIADTSQRVVNSGTQPPDKAILDGDDAGENKTVNNSLTREHRESAVEKHAPIDCAHSANERDSDSPKQHPDFSRGQNSTVVTDSVHDNKLKRSCVDTNSENNSSEDDNKLKRSCVDSESMCDSERTIAHAGSTVDTVIDGNAVLNSFSDARVSSATQSAEIVEEKTSAESKQTADSSVASSDELDGGQERQESDVLRKDESAQDVHTNEVSACQSESENGSSSFEAAMGSVSATHHVVVGHSEVGMTPVDIVPGVDIAPMNSVFSDISSADEEEDARQEQQVDESVEASILESQNHPDTVLSEHIFALEDYTPQNSLKLACSRSEQKADHEISEQNTPESKGADSTVEEQAAVEMGATDSCRGMPLMVSVVGDLDGEGKEVAVKGLTNQAVDRQQMLLLDMVENFTPGEEGEDNHTGQAVTTPQYEDLSPSSDSACPVIGDPSVKLASGFSKESPPVGYSGDSGSTGSGSPSGSCDVVMDQLPIFVGQEEGSLVEQGIINMDVPTVHIPHHIHKRTSSDTPSADFSRTSPDDGLDSGGKLILHGSHGRSRKSKENPLERPIMINIQAPSVNVYSNILHAPGDLPIHSQASAFDPNSVLNFSRSCTVTANTEALRSANSFDSDNARDGVCATEEYPNVNNNFGFLRGSCMQGPPNSQSFQDAYIASLGPGYQSVQSAPSCSFTTPVTPAAFSEATRGQYSSVSNMCSDSANIVWQACQQVLLGSHPQAGPKPSDVVLPCLPPPPPGPFMEVPSVTAAENCFQLPPRAFGGYMPRHTGPPIHPAGFPMPAVPPRTFQNAVTAPVMSDIRFPCDSGMTMPGDGFQGRPLFCVDSREDSMSLGCPNESMGSFGDQYAEFNVPLCLEPDDDSVANQN